PGKRNSSALRLSLRSGRLSVEGVSTQTTSLPSYPEIYPMRLFALLLLLSPLSAADYDVLIRNARIIDGSGNPWQRADLGVKDGRIAAIGRLPTATATRVIDARERTLAPGFIDVHTHIEGGVERNPRGDNFLLDGVTTV